MRVCYGSPKQPQEAEFEVIAVGQFEGIAMMDTVFDSGHRMLITRHGKLNSLPYLVSLIGYHQRPSRSSSSILLFCKAYVWRTLYAPRLPLRDILLHFYTLS